MPNNFLVVGMFAALGWATVSAAPPLPAAESNSVPVAPTRPAGTQTPPVGNLTPMSTRPPVPFVRAPRLAAATPSSSDASVAPPESKKQDDLGKNAARVAVEMDGYKRASIVGKASNGAWRVRAYRGATEVSLIVDGTGRVSLE